VDFAEFRQTFNDLAEGYFSRVDLEAFTPETLSAAYARISRDAAHVSELRRGARFGVARARKSNETIIFGLGHASVAEHAAFNFDVSGISRLASEELQSHRLLSFTEKSQRYITIGRDFVIPTEAEELGLRRHFEASIPMLFDGYLRLFEALQKLHRPESSESLSKTEIRDLETRAKEDARYLLPLACTTQMGMSLNARNLEHVVWEMGDHPLAEVRELSQAIHRSVGKLAPSIVKYTSRAGYPRANRSELAKLAGMCRERRPLELWTSPKARLVSCTPNGEKVALDALGFVPGGSAKPEQVWREVFRNLGPHDPVLREFELATAMFEVEVSATCFAQLKRHRMMTMLPQSYGIEGPAILPPAIAESGETALLEQAVRASQAAASVVERQSELIADYLLTNAQVRRVRLQANARELYHFARLRCDSHAQWEIRDLADQMIALIKKEWPQMMVLACGKDRFAEEYGRVYP
jgi:flavin-dependent thymidylate synthase